jgi:hypothetical protein
MEKNEGKIADRTNSCPTPRIVNVDSPITKARKRAVAKAKAAIGAGRNRFSAVVEDTTKQKQKPHEQSSLARSQQRTEAKVRANAAAARHLHNLTLARERKEQSKKETYLTSAALLITAPRTTRSQKGLRKPKWLTGKEDLVSTRGSSANIADGNGGGGGSTVALNMLPKLFDSSQGSAQSKQPHDEAPISTSLPLQQNDATPNINTNSIVSTTSPMTHTDCVTVNVMSVMSAMITVSKAAVAVLTIQRAFRSWHGRRDKASAAAVRVQPNLTASKARRLLAAIVIQRAYRRWRCQQELQLEVELNAYKKRRHLAVILIQKTYRKWRCQRLMQLEGQTEVDLNECQAQRLLAVLLIQRVFRKWRSQREVGMKICSKGQMYFEQAYLEHLAQTHISTTLTTTVDTTTTTEKTTLSMIPTSTTSPGRVNIRRVEGGSSAQRQQTTKLIKAKLKTQKLHQHVFGAFQPEWKWRVKLYLAKMHSAAVAAGSIVARLRPQPPTHTRRHHPVSVSFLPEGQTWICDFCDRTSEDYDWIIRHEKDCAKQHPSVLKPNTVPKRQRKFPYRTGFAPAAITPQRRRKGDSSASFLTASPPRAQTPASNT